MAERGAARERINRYHVWRGRGRRALCGRLLTGCTIPDHRPAAYANSHSYTYHNTYRYCYYHCHCYSVADFHTDCNTYGYPDWHSNCNCNTDHNSHHNAVSDCHSYAFGESNEYTQANAYRQTGVYA